MIIGCIKGIMVTLFAGSPAVGEGGRMTRRLSDVSDDWLEVFCVTIPSLEQLDAISMVVLFAPGPVAWRGG